MSNLVKQLRKGRNGKKIKSKERETMLALKIQTFFHTELISLCVCAHAFIGLGWA